MPDCCGKKGEATFIEKEPNPPAPPVGPCTSAQAAKAEHKRNKASPAAAFGAALVPNRITSASSADAAIAATMTNR